MLWPRRAISCNQARLRGHGGGGFFAEVHSSPGRRRQYWPDRHGDHGRGILQRKCERYPDDVRDRARSLANLVGRYVGAGQPIAEAILEEEWSAASRVLL